MTCEKVIHDGDGYQASIKTKRRMADHILAIESELADLEKSCDAYREILTRIATKARWLAENDERLKADCHLVHIAMIAEEGLKKAGCGEAEK